VRAPGQHAGAGAGDDDVAVALVARAPRVHIAPDSEFLARYELTDKALGLGSYSQCYKCLRRQDGRFFAVKVQYSTVPYALPCPALPLPAWKGFR
jgi:hypothetical protein